MQAKRLENCQVCGAPNPPSRKRNCSSRCRRLRWEIANAERMPTLHRKWRQEHLDWARQLGRTYAENRRARIAAAKGSFTTLEWLRLCIQYAYACGYCGEWTALAADHRIPLSRGGTNSIENIIPACRTCNSRKGRQTEAEFRASIHFVREDAA